jgi:epoxyqueuosine reductase
MKEKIIEVANYMGIKSIGFTNILEYKYLEKFLLERKLNNYDNEFEEQNLNKRLYVKNVFPECKSIISIGMPYAMGYKKPQTNDNGLISIVSFGEDYHKYMKKILNDLAEEIIRYKEFKYVICVDTSPLIDREICKNSSIGNYGKNSLLIDKDYGSFMYLGYILTDLDIKTENNIENSDICKDCNICFNVCPNDAILKDGGIDSKKCVSYLTQTKTYIPVEYRKNMTNQIYGCDMCQLVCPKNKQVLEMKSKVDYSKLIIDINELMNISNSDFIKKYGYLSGSWRGKNIWKRNGIIAIANLNIKSMYTKVRKELENPSDMIKIYSAWSLMVLDRHKASDILNSNLKYENDIVKNEYKKLLTEDILC